MILNISQVNNNYKAKYSKKAHHYNNYTNTTKKTPHKTKNPSKYLSQKVSKPTT